MCFPSWVLENGKKPKQINEFGVQCFLCAFLHIMLWGQAICLKESIAAVSVWTPLQTLSFVLLCYVSSRVGCNTSDSSVRTERVQEQKEKMQVELQALWTEQCDQMKKKKEQCATEVSEIHLLVWSSLVRLKMREKDLSGERKVDIFSFYSNKHCHTIHLLLPAL